MKRSRAFVVGLSLLLTQLTLGININSHCHTVFDSLKIIEKVYLHVDRDNYYAGDDIWFKAYLIDALDHLLTDHSSNLHVELVSPYSKIISNRIIRLEGGLGNGDFKLPDNIKSGRYKLRAYTNYMRNFGEQLFFSKEIGVINSTDSSEISNRIKFVENKIQISFFPEGGSLVDNVTSNVAFKATNYLDKGINVSGKIYSSDGELVVTFKSSHLGMGSFFLSPRPGLSYYSICRSTDSLDLRTELPTSFPKGVTLSASKNQNNELLVTFKTNPETLADLSELDLLLSISIRKEVINTIPFKIKSPISSFIIPVGYLPEGIIMLTLTTQEDLPLTERLFYIERETPLKILIETDKLLYKKRDPVSLKLSLSGDSIIEREGYLSLAVADETFTNSASLFPRTISSWFLLESDIRGIVEDPSYYFDPSNTDRLMAMDLLLLTQGWRDFTWKYDTTYFPPENGFTVSGRLKIYNKHKNVEDFRISIGILGGMRTLIKSVPIDSAGRFKLSNIDLTGQATLIASGIDEKDHLEGILTLDSVTYNPARVSDGLFMTISLTEPNQNNLKSYYKVNEAIKKKYKLSDTINLGEVNILSERHKDLQTIKLQSSRSKYGKPDAELIITKQMVSYPDPVAALKGRIAGVEIMGTNGNYTIIIRHGSQTFFGHTAPLFLIDGNPATYDDVISLPIIIVERIDVLKSYALTSVFGFDGSNGVINLITKAEGVSDIYKSIHSSAKLPISGYSDSRVFYSPQHLLDTKSDYYPDMRSTLYWNPDINLKNTNEIILNYYNGDNSSFIKIIAEGITTSGIPVTGKAEYEVR